MVLDVIGAVRGKVVTKPDECATDAKEILGLWRTVGYPAPSTMARDLGDVVEWAQRSPDRLAARDIRAEGWAEGVDRSRAIGTLCVRRSWGDRLAAAKDWIARGRPTRGSAGRASPGDTRRDLLGLLDHALENLN